MTGAVETRSRGSLDGRVDTKDTKDTKKPSGEP